MNNTQSQKMNNTQSQMTSMQMLLVIKQKNKVSSSLV